MIPAALTVLVAALLGLSAKKSSVETSHVIALALFFIVPSVASAWVSNARNDEPYLNLPSVFAFVISITFLTRPLSTSKLNGKPLNSWTLLFGIALAVFVTYSGTSRSGLLSLFNCFIAPLALVLSFSVLLKDNERLRAKLTSLLITLAVSESILASVQFYVRSNLLFTDLFRYYQPWFDPSNYSRSQGTFDHPLILATFLLFGICLTIAHVSHWTKWPICLVLILGLILTQSRSGLGIAIAAVLVSFIFSKKMRLSLSFGASIILAGVLWSWSFVQEGVFSLVNRSNNDYGSTQARFDSLGYFYQHMPDFLFGAHGFSSSFALREVSFLNASLENGLLMLLYDLGIVILALVIAGYLLALKYKVSFPQLILSLALTVMISSYSSVSASSAAAVIWFMSFVDLSNTSKTLDQSSPTKILT